MKICKACKKKIDEKATICSYCRTKQPLVIGKPTAIVATIISVVIVLSIFGVIFGGSGSSTDNKSTSSSTPTPTPVATTPLEKDKQAVKDTVTKVLLSDMKLVDGDTKNYPKVDYSSFGWTDKEALIHDVNLVAANPELGSHGRLDIEFSALPLALNTSYYNDAEEATVDVLGALQSVKLNTQVTEITVAAWGMNKDPFGNPACQNLKYMRMTFVDVTPTQLSLVTPEQWQDLNGQQEFDKMSVLGLKPDISAYYEVCKQPSYQQ